MNSHSHNFYFKYIKKGGIAGENQIISFNSETKQIEKISRSSQPIRIILSENEEHQLLDAFDSSNFFNLPNYFFPLEKADSVLHVLISLKDNDVNSCIWSDASEDIPNGLIKLTDDIQNIFAEE
jgi:hypothetical protein